jgi:peroxiredoxin Q/BCP
MTIEIDKPAPHFSEISDSKTIIHLKDYKGKKLILYFYPKDDTPGCTLEACGFRDFYDKISAYGADVIGVSKDSVEDHQKFKKKHQLLFPLIADRDGSICEAYGVMKEKNMMGKKYMGIERSTFLIDEEGIVKQIWRGVQVPGHVDDVMEALKKLPG